MTSHAPRLSISELDVSYGAAQVLFSLSLTVNEGEQVAILGHNGWGKTTLARTVAGFLTPRAGQIVIDGRDSSGLPAHAVARSGVALVPQGRRVFGSLSVEENLRIASPRGERERWREIYDMFPELRTRARQRASTLSGGEQQMLAIGRAVVRRPRLLILDEPTEGLAPVVVERLAHTLRDLVSEQRLTLLLLEQRTAFAETLCDITLWMTGRGRLPDRETPTA